MHLLHPSSMVGGGGGRALRRVDSSPRASLCRSDSMKKKTTKRSKRARLSAALRELKVAAKERDKDGLLQILVTGHRTTSTSSRGSSEDGAGTSTSERSVGAEQRARLWRGQGGGGATDAGGPLLELGGPVGASGRGRRCASSWVMAATLVLALACVVALGTAPAICCCTFAAWLCAERGAQERASGSDDSPARHGSPHAQIFLCENPQ